MNAFRRQKYPVIALIFAVTLVTLCAPSQFGQQVNTVPLRPAPEPKFYGVGVVPPPDFHEDFDSLALSTSKLYPQEPLLGETDDVKANGFIRERYQIGWRPGDALDLYIVRPRNVKNPPVMLYLYGFPADTDRFKNDKWCEYATQGGFAAVGFVSALTGHRYHDRPMKQWFVSELQESLVTTVHDVQMILNYLQTRSDLDTNRVGMFGSGSGGTIAILAASTDARLKVLDVLNPWGDWKEWLATTNRLRAEEHEKFTQPKFLATVSGLDPVEWLAKLKTQRVRIQNMRENPEVSDKAELALEAAAPETAVIYQYGDNIAFVRAAAGGGNTFGWAKKQLMADPAEKVVADRKANTRFFEALGTKLPDPNKPIERMN